MVLQMIHYVFHAIAITNAFRIVQIKRRRRELLPVTLAAMAVNVIAPSMNISGVAYLVDDARRRGHSSAGALVATGGTILVDGLVFILFSLIVAVLLVVKNEFTLIMAVGIAALIALVVGLTGIIVYFWYKPHKLERFLKILGRERAKKWADEWQVIRAMPLQKNQIFQIIFPEIGSHLCNFASLACIFLAFHSDPFNVLPAVAYMVNVLFIILSPTPMGIGFAEGGIIAILTGSGIPLTVASAIALAYRGISFWIPFFIGAGILHFLHLNELGEPDAPTN